MKIYTSYYWQIRNFPKDLVPVSIALYKPEWYNGLEYTTLAPTSEILRDYKSGRLTDDQYVKRFYVEKLYPLNQYKVYQELFKLSGGKDVALCCYEPKGKFCHRYTVGVFLNKEGFGVTEWFKK